VTPKPFRALADAGRSGDADAIAAAQAAAPLRVVVNCAGIAPPAKVLDRDGTPAVLADFERIVRINLVGTFNVISQAAAVIAANELHDEERGVIVNTASVAAFDGQIGQPAYSASKGGVHAMTLPIARELARHAIRVCTIAPGITEFVNGLPPQYNVAVVSMSGNPAVRLPPTTDRAMTTRAIEALQPQDSTAMGDAIYTALDAIRMAPR